MGSSGYSVQDQRETRKAEMQGYWEQYNKWVTDAESRHVSETSTAKARMAAGGQKEGSEGWETTMRGVNEAYEKELADLQGGAHYQALSDYYQGELKYSEKRLGQTKSGATQEQWQISGMQEGGRDYTGFGDKYAAQQVTDERLKGYGSMEEFFAGEFGGIAPTETPEAAPTGAKSLIP